MTSATRTRIVLLLAAVLLATGCADTDGGEGSPPPGSEAARSGPLYAISSISFGANDTQTTTVALVPSLEAGTKVDYTKALELSGGANLKGVEKTGRFFMLGGESPTLVKYEVDAEGRLARRETLSFAGEGVTSLGGAPVGFAGDKGYLVDVGGFRGFVWDPRTMTITKRFDTRALALGDMPAYAAEGQLILQSDRLFGFVYHTSDKQETVGKEARVLVIDTRTDEVTTIADPRCGGLRYAARMPNGDIYATSDTWTAIVHRLDEARAPAPCMLRIKAGEARFDPDFHVKLSTLTGGLPTGGFIPVGDGEILVRALDEALAPVTPTTTGRDLFGARAWRTWRVTLPGAAPGAPVAALAPNIAGILFHAVDGEVFTNDTAADYGRTTFVRLTGPQGPKAGLEIRGVPFDLLRIR